MPFSSDQIYSICNHELKFQEFIFCALSWNTSPLKLKISIWAFLSKGLGQFKFRKCNMGYMKFDSLFSFNSPLIPTQPGIWQLKCDLLLLLIQQRTCILQGLLQTVSSDWPLVAQMSKCKPGLYWYRGVNGKSNWNKKTYFIIRQADATLSIYKE